MHTLNVFLNQGISQPQYKAHTLKKGSRHPFPPSYPQQRTSSSLRQLLHLRKHGDINIPVRLVRSRRPTNNTFRLPPRVLAQIRDMAQRNMVHQRFDAAVDARHLVF